MPIKCIPADVQTAIAQQYASTKITMRELGEVYGIKPTTLRRVLAEQGVIAPIDFHKTAKEIALLDCLAAYKVNDVEQLRRVLARNSH